VKVTRNLSFSTEWPGRVAWARANPVANPSMALTRPPPTSAMLVLTGGQSKKDCTMF
jgi:hypothetical protein